MCDGLDIGELELCAPLDGSIDNLEQSNEYSIEHLTEDDLNAALDNQDNPDAEKDIVHQVDPVEDSDIDVIIAAINDMRSISDDLTDPELFTSREPGEYEYGESIFGKSARGVLQMSENPVRDPVAQREAGGLDRRLDDDGGHLIGARFGGSAGIENLDAQNRQLNRGDYKTMENDLAKHIANGDKVFLSVDTTKLGKGERPVDYSGHSIIEHPDGSREYNSFSFPNQGKEEQEAWGEPSSDGVNDADLEAALHDMEYSDGLEGDSIS